MAKKTNTYLLLIPVFNLEIGRELNREIRIGDVIFVSTKKIPYIRKRLGFKRKISELKNELTWSWNILERAKTYAVLKWRLENKKAIEKPISMIKEAIWILASSHPSASRTNVRLFGLPEHKKHLINEYFAYNTKEDNFSFSTFISPSSQLEPFRLDAQWKNIMKRHFFPSAVNIINDKKNVKEHWKHDIKNTLVLVGKSLFSGDLSQAFLYNMIGIETLLTRAGDKFPDELINRLNALFSWRFSQDGTFVWNNKIKEIYKLRCEAIHNGKISKITVEHLIITDLIIQNLLYNICKSTKHIKEKQDLIMFTKESQAREILNIPPKYPFRIRFSTYWPSKSQIDKIKSRMTWS